MTAETPKPVRRFRRTRRLLKILACLYVGILIVILIFEKHFIYHPSTAAEYWRSKPHGQFEDVTLSSSAGDSIHGWWLSRPNAKSAVLYSHGNGGNLSLWGPRMVDWHNALDVSVLIYDYPGYGRSSGAPSEAGCYAAADAAWEWLIQKQNVAPEKVILAGESLGGALAVDLASRHPYRALVLLKPFSSIPDMAGEVFPWLPGRYLVRTQFNSFAKIKNCRGPLFLYHGERDTLIPYSQGKKLFDVAPGPKEMYTDPIGTHDTRLPGDFFVRLDAFLRANAPE
ncbi:MAG: alpha/beta hydrolase [Gemmataceae bacterium]